MFSLPPPPHPLKVRKRQAKAHAMYFVLLHDPLAALPGPRVRRRNGLKSDSIVSVFVSMLMGHDLGLDRERQGHISGFLMENGGNFPRVAIRRQ